MPFLIAALVLIGLLAVLNLGLTLALIRRLREADAGPSGPMPRLPKVALEVGDLPGEFIAETIAGQPLNPANLAGHLVGFFTPHCEPCHERLPEFVEYARNTGAVAVLLGEPEEVADMAEMVSGVAQIAIQPPGGPMWTAFAVRSVPALCLLDGNGRALASGPTFQSFPTLATAR